MTVTYQETHIWYRFNTLVWTFWHLNKRSLWPRWSSWYGHHWPVSRRVTPVSWQDGVSSLIGRTPIFWLSCLLTIKSDIVKGFSYIFAGWWMDLSTNVWPVLTKFAGTKSSFYVDKPVKVYMYLHLFPTQVSVVRQYSTCGNISYNISWLCPVQTSKTRNHACYCCGVNADIRTNHHKWTVVV